MGFDLNRHWHDPSLWAHPTLHATKKLLMEYNQDPVSYFTKQLHVANVSYFKEKLSIV